MQKQTKLALFWVGFGVLGRLIPHLPNVTPLNSLCLFAGSRLNRILAYFSTFAILLFSDIALSYLEGYPILTAWTFFSYTGFAAIIWLGSYLPRKTNLARFLSVVIVSSVGFWLWTNFGVWLTSAALYPHSINGLITCYAMALPFLRNALSGDLIWAVVIFKLFDLVWARLDKHESDKKLLSTSRG
jgi:hypothetical protein